MTGIASAIRIWCLRHLARPQPGQSFIPQIDGLRFLAIIAVLFYHLQGYVEARAGLAADGPREWLHALFAVGHFGVPLFFAISGYIIARPFLAPRGVSLRNYFLRRLSRLEPPYFINLLIIFVLKILFLGISFPDLFPHLLASLLYLHGPIYGTHSEVNVVAWSLEVEWQFYVLAPLILGLMLRTGGAMRHVALCLLVLLGGWAFRSGPDMDSRLSLSLLRYAGFFFAGIWVAVLDHEGRLQGLGQRAFDALGMLAGILILLCLLQGRSVAPAMPILSFLFVLCALRGAWFSTVLGWWPVHCIGAMCYSIYLYHFFVISAVGKAYSILLPWPASDSLAILMFALVATPLTLAVCAIPYVLIERPFMVWRPGQNRLRDAFRWRQPAPAGAGPVTTMSAAESR